MSSVKAQRLEYEITVPRWDDFQHYKKGTIWIKAYCRLLSDRSYVRLTFGQRGLLQSIWLEYARANHGRPVGDSRALHGHTAELSRQFGQRVSAAQLEALNHAGFITLKSRPALEEVPRSTRPEEKRREEKNHNPSTTTNVVPLHPESVGDLKTVGSVIAEAGGLPAFLENLGRESA